MPYIVIEDFRAGLDRRKLPAASPPGSLQVLSNAHINRGGEIEKRRAFEATYALPGGQTFGLAGTSGNLYVFGSVASASAPAGVIYQRLQHPSGVSMARVVASEFYNGKPAVIASYTNGDVLLFYDGVRMASWDAGGDPNVQGQKPTALLTLRDKLYATYLSVLAFSAVGAPTNFAGTGAGIINMSNQSAGSETLTGLGRYQGLMAVFARRNTQIWQMDPDPLNNTQRQVLSNIGTFAAKSIVSFGDADVFFLSDTGIRSLRARDSSNQAGISDVGTPIDDEVLAYLATLTDAEKAAAVAIIDPIDGRYICAIGNRAYVFSYYASSRISAWSSYDLGFTVSDFVSMDGQIWARAGDAIYRLGGATGDVYDGTSAIVETPYIDGRTIATFKQFTGIDLVSEGEWMIYANTDPDQADAWSLIATASGTGTNRLRIGMVGYSPLVKFRMVSTRPGPAKLSKIIIHYEAADQG